MEPSNTNYPKAFWAVYYYSCNHHVNFNRLKAQDSRHKTQGQKLRSIELPEGLMVAIATGFHLFPFRTEKLSPLAPMVLRKSGRVGRCQLYQACVHPSTGLFCYIIIEGTFF